MRTTATAGLCSVGQLLQYLRSNSRSVPSSELLRMRPSGEVATDRMARSCAWCTWAMGHLTRRSKQVIDLDPEPATIRFWSHSTLIATIWPMEEAEEGSNVYNARLPPL